MKENKKKKNWRKVSVKNKLLLHRFIDLPNSLRLELLFFKDFLI